MPAYNSIFNSEPSPRLIGNFPLLPLRTKTRGPAYTLPLDPSLPPNESPEPDSESYDAVDEVISLFRANTFFRNFEIQGPADRLLIYGILFLSECLGKIRPNMGARRWWGREIGVYAEHGCYGDGWLTWENHNREAQKEVQNIALDNNFSIPGDPGFPLNQMFEPPRDRQEAEILRQYLAQVRQEIAARILARVYDDIDSKPSKWWLSFTKRKFMGKNL
ncbi:hypothetical protein DH86_00001398 [Scytalidium sp. 3C]|nr:hypothetical protein DH86_00001398 [Scytalidium sp. 3C]